METSRAFRYLQRVALASASGVVAATVAHVLTGHMEPILALPLAETAIESGREALAHKFGAEIHEDLVEEMRKHDAQTNHHLLRIVMLSVADALSETAQLQDSRRVKDDLLARKRSIEVRSTSRPKTQEFAERLNTEITRYVSLVGGSSPDEVIVDIILREESDPRMEALPVAVLVFMTEPSEFEPSDQVFDQVLVQYKISLVKKSREILVTDRITRDKFNLVYQKLNRKAQIEQSSDIASLLEGVNLQRRFAEQTLQAQQEMNQMLHAIFGRMAAVENRLEALENEVRQMRTEVVAVHSETREMRQLVEAVLENQLAMERRLAGAFYG